jgi:hypothetical protein
MQAKSIIQTRQDLESIKGSQEYFEFIKLLKGSMVKKVCTTVYPEDYDHDLTPNDEGYIPLEFGEIENLEEISRFEFTKEDLLLIETP